MSRITMLGNPFNTNSILPKVGSQAPDFKLTKGDLSGVSLKDFAGKKLVLNIYPSIDTEVCSNSVRKFNVEAASLPNTMVVGVSKDLPFALKRFCAAEGVDKVTSTSSMHDDSFESKYGVRITDGFLAGLMARAVVVIDEKGTVVYTQLLGELAEEPDYAAAIEAVKAA